MNGCDYSAPHQPELSNPLVRDLIDHPDPQKPPGNGQKDRPAAQQAASPQGRDEAKDGAADTGAEIIE